MLVPIAIGIGCWEGLIKNFVNSLEINAYG